MKILISGDLAPTRSNIDIFKRAGINTLLGEKLLDIWNSAEAKIINLETPIAELETPIAKCGPNLITPTNAIEGIVALNPSLFSLANNHILDQGVHGFDSTRKLLEKNKIPYVGVGNNVDEAAKPYVLSIKGFQIGIYACAEHEFSIATEYSPGANPFDPLESLDHIEKLKNKCDFVIVLYHGGKEYYRYPSPYLQKVCRKIVEKGADIIVCQHSHCIGCFEKFNAATIIYGQGNFLFDYSEKIECQTSILLMIEIDKEINVRYIPIIKEGSLVRLAENKRARDILLAFHQRSIDILREGFIEKQYSIFANEHFQSYLWSLSGMSKWIRRIDKYLLKGILLKIKYNKSMLMKIRNSIECEAHRELLIRGINEVLERN